MFFVGVDLHKQVIKLCVIKKVRGKREIVARRQFACREPGEIRAYFEGLDRFRVVVEATASYEWFFLLIEDLADRHDPGGIPSFAADSSVPRVGTASLALGASDRFETDALLEQLTLFGRQLSAVDAELAKFAETAPLAEREARAILASIPRIGPVTIDVVLSELGDWRRFRGAEAVVDFAGLSPGIRESAGRRCELSITKEGSRLLRWAMVQAAWRLAIRSPRWNRLYLRLQRNTGSKKKAIVGVARQLLCVMFSMLQSGQTYRLAA